MNKIKCLIIFSLILLGTLKANTIEDFSSYKNFQNEIKTSHKLNITEVISDANQAIKEEDYRLISIKGVSFAGITVIEGIEFNDLDESSYPLPIKTISGGGCIQDENTENDHNYAKIYNTYMFDYLLKNNLISKFKVDKKIFNNLSKYRKKIILKNKNNYFEITVKGNWILYKKL